MNNSCLKNVLGRVVAPSTHEIMWRRTCTRTLITCKIYIHLFLFIRQYRRVIAVIGFRRYTCVSRGKIDLTREEPEANTHVEFSDEYDHCEWTKRPFNSPETRNTLIAVAVYFSTKCTADDHFRVTPSHHSPITWSTVCCGMLRKKKKTYFQYGGTVIKNKIIIRYGYTNFHKQTPGKFSDGPFSQ